MKSTPSTGSTSLPCRTDIEPKVGPHLSITAGFIHYKTAQALGPLRGNEVRLSTRTQF